MDKVYAVMGMDLYEFGGGQWVHKLYSSKAKAAAWIVNNPDPDEQFVYHVREYDVDEDG